MPSTKPTLAVLCAALLVLAGCAGVPSDTATESTTAAQTTAPTSTDSEPTTTSTQSTTDRPTTDASHDRWIRGSAYTVNEETVAFESSIEVDELDAADARMVNGTIENGSYTTTTVQDVYSGGHYPIQVGGSYYDVDRTEVESEQVRVHQFKVSGPIDEDDPEYEDATRDAIAVENLSAPDRRVFEEGMPSDAELDGIAMFTRSFPIHFENGTAPEALGFDESGIHYVEDDGEYYSVEFDEARQTDRVTYRYTATHVASSTDAYVDIALDRYVTNASNTTLSADAHEILVSTLENGSIYYHSETPDIAQDYEEFYHWTRDHQFVRYDGDIYRLDIMRVME